jgi:CRP-like cAMP-binding protein/membrane protein YdbS with pleckstrin-like domain
MSNITSSSSSAFATLLAHLPYLEKASKNISDGQEIGYLLSTVEFVTFDATYFLYLQGRPVEKLYLLLTGRVEEARIQGKQRRLMRESGPGRLLGVYDLLYRQPHSTWARAMEPCQAIAIDAKVVNRLLYRFPNLRSEMAPLRRIARMQSIPLFEGADLTALSYLADCAEEKELAANERLYGPGQPAETVYLIDQGQMALDWGGTRIWMGNGGELGMEEYISGQSGSPYALDHSASAVCPTRLICFPRKQIGFIAGIHPEEKAKSLRAERKSVIDSLHVFSEWPAEARQQVLGAMSHYHIPTNHLLTQQAEIADSLWVLMPGRRALLHATDKENRALPETRAEGLTYFNEAALLYQASAASTLEAEAGSQWLRLHFRDFRAFLKQVDQPELEEQLQAGEMDEQKADAQSQPVFSWLRRGERIVFLARRHWVVLVRKLIWAILLTFLVLLGLALIFLAGYDPTWLLVTTGFLALLMLGAYWWGIEDYRNDYLIVTNLRVVRQEKVIFLRETRQIAPLEAVQNVGVQIGFWGRLLGYADVNIQTASTTGMIRFDHMAGYTTVAQHLEAERMRRRQYYAATGKKQIYSLLENRLGVAVELPSRVWPRDGVSEEERAAEGKSSLVEQQIERDTGERIVWRKHWIVLFRNLSLPVIFLISALSGALLIWLFRVAGPYTEAVSALPLLGAVILAGLVFWIVEDWLNDRYILEKDQVIDIEAKPLGFDEKRKVALLSNIVDINMAMPSPIHYIFNFGYVYLQTAATEGRFTFDAVPDPHGVVEIVRQRMDAVRRRAEETAAQQRAQELPEWFEIYNRLGSQQESNK